jgi:hypothetical protein
MNCIRFHFESLFVVFGLFPDEQLQDLPYRDGAHPEDRPGIVAEGGGISHLRLSLRLPEDAQHKQPWQQTHAVAAVFAHAI